MQTTAQDLGASGRDNYYGYGLVDAKTALGKVIPLIQSVASSPAVVGPGVPVTVHVTLSTSTGVASLKADDVSLSQNGGVWTGSVPAQSEVGPHTIDISLTDNWGNTSHDTSLTYTTSANLTPPKVAIGSPSASVVSSGPVAYPVTYSGANVVTLAASAVTLNRTGNANGIVSVNGSGTTNRTVTISNITGDGTIGISIASGTATGSGGTAPAAGPSPTFTVSNQGPTVTFTSPTTGPTLARNCPSLDIAGSASDPYGVSKVTWSTAGGAKGNCTGTTSWSANGIPLAAGSNTLTVTATDSLGNTGIATLSVTYIDARTGNAWQGNAMVSIPIIPDSIDPRPLVGFDGHGWYAYDAGASRYIGYSDQTSWLTPPDSTPGRGFWAYFGSGGGNTPYGTIPSQTEPVTIHLYPGWNLIGNPFISDVTWDIGTIKVRKPTTTNPIALRYASDWVDSYAWGWNASTDAYYLVVDANYSKNTAGSLEPWHGYWLKAYEECELILPAP